MLQHNFDPSKVTLSADLITYNILNFLAYSSQISFRLYLKYVKGIQESNEILTPYFAYTLLAIYAIIFLVMFLVESSLALRISGYISLIARFTILPLLIILLHSGVNAFYFESHPKVRKVFILIFPKSLLSKNSEVNERNLEPTQDSIKIQTPSVHPHCNCKPNTQPIPNHPRLSNISRGAMLTDIEV